MLETTLAVVLVLIVVGLPAHYIVNLFEDRRHAEHAARRRRQERDFLNHTRNIVEGLRGR